MPESSENNYECDVFVSYPGQEVAWARRLIADLSARGLRCFSDQNLRPGERWKEAMERALEDSRILVVLWSPSAREAPGMLTEIIDFNAIVQRGDRPRYILPVMLGGSELLSTAPEALASRHALLVSAEAYAAGPTVDSPEWQRVVDAIEKQAEHTRATGGRSSVKQEPSTPSPAPGSTLAPASSPAPGSTLAPASTPAPADASASMETVPRFSGMAQMALTLAGEMLGDDERSESHTRTAALLGALLASAYGGMAPSTGDVARLVLARQRSERSVQQAIAAAASAAGLAPPPSSQPLTLIEPVLTGSSTAALVRDAADVQRRTGAEGIDLRHILTVGVHRGVSEAALAELGFTLPELQAQWRASILSRPLDDPRENWVKLLGEHVAISPPTARVHADRWTIKDRLDYALYAKAIAEFIRHPDAEPPMVISVQAPWGQGKTSLMRMVQNDLDPGHPDLVHADDGRRPGLAVEQSSALTFKTLRSSLGGDVPIGEDIKPGSIRTVWFNAWKYQSSEQIWAGLAHAILAQLPARLSVKDRELFWLRLQRRRIDPAAVRNDIHRAALERFLPKLVGLTLLGLGALVVLGLALLAGGLGAAGVGVAGAGVIGTLWRAWQAWAAATADALQRPLEGAYLRYVRQPDYSGHLGYLHLVEEDMTNALELLTPDDQPAVIFIDDLDRCSPAKIGEVIEAVNLFLAGEYPHCAFVIGIDAEVVAASMEVVHAQIIEKLRGRRGELGWRFMDKFVQLPFVMPRLQSDQREDYLRGLFSTLPSGDPQAVLAEAARLEGQVDGLAMSVDELAEAVGDLAPRLAAVAPDRARALAEKVVTAGARAFSDEDPEVVDALADQMRYLSDNPRTIKRAVNLYRFNRFTAFARQVSTQPLDIATPAQIGRWTVVIVRWPQFVRWLQAGREQDSSSPDLAKRVHELAAKADDARELKLALRNDEIDATWMDDFELLEFLSEQTDPELQLDRASPCGLW
jgi:hypothetical protein